MSKYLMRPFEVEAVMFNGVTVGDPARDGTLIEGTTPDWFGDHTTSRIAQEISVPLPPGDMMRTGDNVLLVGSPRGTVSCQPGDWLVMYPDGTLFVEKADVFAVTYALPLDVVNEISGASEDLPSKSWLGRIVAGAKALVKSDQEKLF